MVTDSKRQSDKARSDSHRVALNEYKASKPCLCGESDPRALVFLENETSKSNFVGITGRSLESLLEEADRRIVVCSNCRRKINAGLLVLLTRSCTNGSLVR